MVHFNKPQYPTSVAKKKDIPKGVWVKCPLSGEIVFNKDLEANQMVVPEERLPFPHQARATASSTCSIPEPSRNLPQNVRAADPLGFVDSQPYPERLKKYEKESGLNEAVVCGTGMIHGIPVALAVMDFRFCGGAMGGATGEKITRAIEMALAGEDSLHHLQRRRRRAHAGGHFLADADGEDQRGAGPARSGPAPVHLRPHGSRPPAGSRPVLRRSAMSSLPSPVR